MLFFKLLIGVPLAIALLVFAFVNNTMVDLNLWPTAFEITVSLSVLIVLLYVLGYGVGWFFTWLSYAPIRRSLRSQKKQNQKMSREQEKLNKEVEGLRGNIDALKAAVPMDQPLNFWGRIKNSFRIKAKG